MAQHHLVVADTAEVVHRGVAAGRAWHVVNHVTIPAGQPVNVTLAQAIFNAVAIQWNTSLSPQMATTTQYQAVDMRDLRTPNQAIVSSTSAAVVGAAPSSDALPASLASVLTLRTAQAGRKFRGRSYWPGFAEIANDATGLISAAAKTALDAFAAQYITAHSQSGCSLAVTHRPTAFDEGTGLPISPGLGFSTPVIQVLVRDRRWDSQRRRLGR